SNIANISLVLGLTAIILPIPVAVATLKRDWPIMMFISLLFFIFILNGMLDNWEGFIFVGLLLGYIISQLKSSKNSEEEKTEVIKQHILVSILFITVGVIGLAFGADWLVQGAVTFAKNFGVSEHIIAVTIVAFGTSVPELVTSVVAAVKKQMDISVGNLIGSNIFNILGVLGITAIFKEVPISETVITNDIFWVLGTSLILLPLMLNYNIARWKGGILFVSYLLYVYFLLQTI